MKQLITLNQLISKYLMILIIGFSCIAYIVPSYFSWAIAYTPFFTWNRHVWHGTNY